ncbi:MAG: glycosyltransferase [Actinomycetes bacterium]
MRPSGDEPFVLLVVPTLGTRPDYLRESLESLQAQTYSRLRVAVVGPSDDTLAAMAGHYGMAFIPQPRSGIGAAINAGWRALGSGAEVWGWLGDDDLLPSWSVQTAVRVLQRTNAVMVFGQCRYIDPDGATLWTAKPTRLAAINLGGGVDLIPQPGSLALAKAIRRVGFLDEGLRYAMDYDLFLRLRKIGRLSYVPTVLSSFRWHEGSLTAAQGSGSEEEAAIVRRRHRAGRAGEAASRLEPLTMKASKLHWHLQRRPLNVMLPDLLRSMR